MLRRAIFFPVLFMSVIFENAQGGLIQVSGFVVEEATGDPLPYAHVLNPGKNIGRVSNEAGFFTMIGEIGDTITFSTVGFKTVNHVVSRQSRHLLIEMEIDVQLLPEAEILPLPKNLLILKEDLRSRQIVNATTTLQKNMERAGFKPPPAFPTPPPPSIMNPISFLYEKFIKKIQLKRPKKGILDVIL